MEILITAITSSPQSILTPVRQSLRGATWNDWTDRNAHFCRDDARMTRPNRWLVAGLTALALLGKAVTQKFLPTRPSSETNPRRRRIRYRRQEVRGVVRALA